MQLVDDLRRELDYLQIFKSEMEHPGKGKGLSEFNAKTMEMEHEVRRLKQVCELTLWVHEDGGSPVIQLVMEEWYL